MPVVARLAARSVRAQWRRSVLTATAVAASVAFVTGALLVGDAVHHAYAQVSHTTSSTVDVYVRGPETDLHHGISDFAPLPARMVESVGAVSGVAVAEGEVTRLGSLVTTSGEFLGQQTYVFSWLTSARLLPFTLSAGRAPSGPKEVVLDAASARSDGLGLGAKVRVGIDVASPTPATVVGLVTPRSGGDLSGATAVFVDARWAQTILGIGEQWDLIEVDAAHGVTPETLRDRLQRIVPDDGTSVVTGKQYEAAQVANLSHRAGAVATLLAALAALAALVSVGVIASTTAIALRQRRREIALLRIAGTTRAQVVREVTLEAALVAVPAAGLGAALGIPAAAALRSLANRSDVLPPLHVTLLLPVSVCAAGAAIAVAAVALPAWRAASRRPMEAQGEADLQLRRPAPWWPGAALAVLALAAIPLAELATALLAAASALALLPAATQRSARFLRGTPPRTIAAAHARAAPRRVVVPAAVLAGGIGLVAAVGVVSSSTAASIANLVRRTDRADLVVVSDAAPGIDPEAVEAIREAPAVAVVTELGADAFVVNGNSDQFTALDTDTSASTLDLRVVSGTLRGFADGDIAITSSTAGSHHLRVGDYVSTRFGIPQIRYLEVTAVIADNGITRGWIVPFETYRRGDFTTPIRTLFVDGVAGTTMARLVRQVDVGVSGFPGVSVNDAAAFASREARAVEGPVDLIDVLVGLAIAIALLGVADALGLGVVERAPELALYSPLGLPPRELFATVCWDAALIAALGAAAGLAGGLTAGAAVASALHGSGLTVLRVPVLRLAVVVATTGVVALLAAVMPARRAASTDPLALVRGLG